MGKVMLKHANGEQIINGGNVMNFKGKLVFTLICIGLVASIIFAFWIHLQGRKRALSEAKIKGNEMIQRSAQMFMVSTMRFHDAYAAESDPQKKKLILDDWNRTIEAVDEAVIHDFGADKPRVRLIGDDGIVGVKPAAKGESTKIKIPFEEKALRAFMAGKDLIEETENDVYRVALPLLNNMHAGCAECHGVKLDGRIVMGSVNAYIPLKDLYAQATNETVKTSSIIILILAGLIGVIGFYFSRYMIRPMQIIIGKLMAISNQLFSSTSHITTSSQSLAEGASEQAASLEETSSSLEEMSSMTRQNADNAEQGKNLASQARNSADFGANEMKGMSQAMNDIKTASDGISRIIKTIDEIAFQTNILALNAAVEAARAGDAGMGFAVVADEVRNLAQRSAQAAKETASKIEDSIQKSERGVQISGKVEQALTEILTKVRLVDDLSAEIASASKEQKQGIEQLNTAVSQMDKVTQSTAATAEESASTAEELNSQARTLKGVVEDLIRLTGASTQSPSHDNKSSAGASAAIGANPAFSAKNNGAKHEKNGSNGPIRPANNGMRQEGSSTAKQSAISKDSFSDF